MPKSRPPYPPELRRRLVEMVRAGRSPAQLGRLPVSGGGRRCLEPAGGRLVDGDASAY